MISEKFTRLNVHFKFQLYSPREFMKKELYKWPTTAQNYETLKHFLSTLSQA